MKLLKKLLEKYGAFVRYAIFGALTTVVNVVVYFLCYDVAGIANVPSTIVAWIVAVAFAFVTNKLFVFGSRSWQAGKALREAATFLLCRVGTGVIEVLLMYVLVDRLAFDGTVTKLAVNILVIVLNYIASKLFIFVKK